jgi:predicted regulator of Ras-like GTPase activity (Roadblock/LC7/MglB family)
VDAAQALADLIEISTQIESAVLVDSKGGVDASNLGDPTAADALARAAGELLVAAEEGSSGAESREPLVQLQVATADGCVFVVRDEERLVAAVTVSDPTVGLVFYDLKTCLRHAAGEELTPKPKARTEQEESSDDGEG